MENVNIVITEQDIDALSRLVHAEAKGIVPGYMEQGYTLEEAQKLTYLPLVDTILNRVSSQTSRYGFSVQEVINKPGQYDPITRAGGTWEGIDPVDTSISRIIENYFQDLVSGNENVSQYAPYQNSYINPSDISALPGWNGTYAGQGWGDDMWYKEYHGTNPLNEDGSPKTSFVQGHIIGLIAKNGDGSSAPKPSNYNLSFDVDGDGIIGVGESVEIRPYPVPPLPEHKPDFSSPEFTPIMPWMDGVINRATTARTEASPLVLDLDGDGIELSTLNGEGSVYWDIDQDGMAEASGWVGADDGLLALDRDNNGYIDSHAELFGTETTDGFIMLSELDTNNDGIIDAYYVAQNVAVNDNEMHEPKTACRA